MSITKKIDHFSIEQICESGQCFRMNRLDNGSIEVIAFDKYLTVSQTGSQVTFDCSESDYKNLWRHYFDINETDYGKIKESVDKDDTYLQNAIKYGYGIRIINQDLWEMIISFIISQRNNIKRIKTCIRRLCEKFGEKHVIYSADGAEAGFFYSFPTAEALFNADIEDISSCGVGYRDVYIKRAAEHIFTGVFDMDMLHGMDYISAKNELLKLFGVGEKVADCICLFALHMTEAFPKDTHIISIINNEYSGNFPFEKYEKYAGVLQQYMFYYDLNRQGIK